MIAGAMVTAGARGRCARENLQSSGAESQTRPRYECRTFQHANIVRVPRPSARLSGCPNAYVVAIRTGVLVCCQQHARASRSQPQPVAKLSAMTVIWMWMSSRTLPDGVRGKSEETDQRSGIVGCHDHSTERRSSARGPTQSSS